MSKGNRVTTTTAAKSPSTGTGVKFPAPFSIFNPLFVFYSTCIYLTGLNWAFVYLDVYGLTKDWVMENQEMNNRTGPVVNQVKKLCFYS